MKLNNPSLLISQGYFNGKWINGNSTFQVFNPSSKELLAEIPDLGKEETAQAIQFAYKTFGYWKQTSVAERATILKKWHRLMLENEDDLAQILSLEQGKPYKEALGEIRYGASYIEWFAEEARRIYGDIIPGHEVDKRIMVLKQAVGVVGIITPWNFPNAMIARKVAPALTAGCTVVIKPAAQTPLSALAMAYLGEKAGIPCGVIQIITSDKAAEVGLEMCTNPHLRKISFTGSTKIGKVLMQQCAGQLKKLSLELGGNAPFIVFDDADIDEAVKGAILSKFRNAGQTCVCSNRIYVQESIYKLFIEKFIQAVSQLKVGDGLLDGVEIGPLIDNNALSKVQHIIEDALQKGAKLSYGGNLHPLGGTFFEPTILTDCREDMLCASHEIFGPIAPIFTFQTEQEVIEYANASEYGLAAYFYSQNINRIYKVFESLEFGMIGVNTGLISTAVAPFGGMKESGFGREGSKYGIDEYLDKKYVCIGGIV